MNIGHGYIVWYTYHGEEPIIWVLIIQKLTSEGTRGRMHCLAPPNDMTEVYKSI